MNGGGLELVGPGHLRGRVGSVITLSCQAAPGDVKIGSLTYGTDILAGEPFSIAIEPGAKICSLALAGGQEGVKGAIFGQYRGHQSKLVEFENKTGSMITFVVEGL
jgi:hypothetical protein